MGFFFIRPVASSFIFFFLQKNKQTVFGLVSRKKDVS